MRQLQRSMLTGYGKQNPGQNPDQQTKDMGRKTGDIGQ